MKSTTWDENGIHEMRFTTSQKGFGHPSNLVAEKLDIELNRLHRTPLAVKPRKTARIPHPHAAGSAHLVRKQLTRALHTRTPHQN
jgi:hypothetical protein